MDSVREYEESSTITLEWTLRGLKKLFESSKGDSKSKVIKSSRFGGGRWQILFYANSGTELGGYVSLYLSCEPTTEEKEKAIHGKWVREGLYKFSFELRNIGKTVLFNSKEACDHSFSYKTANWGWAQFARRESVYYSPNTVKHHDAFLIVCTITSSPSAPSVIPSIPCQLVPKGLLDAIGALLDDPVYSDVVFVLPRRGRRGGVRKIYAARRLLTRAEYFQSMFSSGFAEAPTERLTLSAASSQATVSDTDLLDGRASEVGSALIRHFEDSDDEDEDSILDNDLDFDGIHDVDDDQETQNLHVPACLVNLSRETIEAVSTPCDQANSTELPVLAQRSTVSSGDYIHIHPEAETGADVDRTPVRNVRAKLSHPSSPRAMDVEFPEDQESSIPGSEPLHRHRKNKIPGPEKVKVVVKDVAYSTYRAVLYYLYTDTILFAPLSSSFYSTNSSGEMSATGSSAVSSQAQTPVDGQENPSSSQRQVLKSDVSLSSTVPKSRREWIREWEKNNPGKPGPCSAKAVYRLADKLDLRELKTRAFQHIVKSLTVQNAPYEMFSTFSAAFEEVRKMQVNFFLDNWADIRGSDAMRNVWQQIRVGRHPGFEEVWPLIAVNLEFRPRGGDPAGGDGRESSIADA